MVAVIKAPERTEFSLVVYRLLWGLEKRVENARLHAAKCVVQTCGSGTGPAPSLSILFPWVGSVTKSEARLVASRLQHFPPSNPSARIIGLRDHAQLFSLY